MDNHPIAQTNPTHYRGGELLSDHNYPTWANLAKTFLQSQRLFRPVILTQPPPQDAEVEELVDWEAHNAEAKDYLLRSMSSSYRVTYAYVETAREIWRSLAARFHRGDERTRLDYRKKLVNLAYDENVSLPAYFNTVRQLRLQCEAIGEHVTEQTALYYALEGIRCEHLRHTVESLTLRDDLTLAQAEAFLIKADARFAQPNFEFAIAQDVPQGIRPVLRPFLSRAKPSGNTRRRTPPVDLCTFCQKPGHLEQHCWTKQRLNDRQRDPNSGSTRPASRPRPRRPRRPDTRVNLLHQDDPPDSYGSYPSGDDDDAPTAVAHSAFNQCTEVTNAYLFKATAGTQRMMQTQFFSDSGASVHIINNLEWLYNPTPVNVDISLAGQDKKIHATHSGSICLRSRNSIVTLKDVLFCKDAAANLISTPRLDRRGIHVHHGGGRVEIWAPDGSIAISGTLYTNDTYVLDVTPIVGDPQRYISKARKIITAPNADLPNQLVLLHNEAVRMTQSFQSPCHQAEQAQEALNMVNMKIERMEQEAERMQHCINMLQTQLKPEKKAKKKLQAHLTKLQPLPDMLKGTELTLKQQQTQLSAQASLITELTGKVEKAMEEVRLANKRFLTFGSEKEALRQPLNTTDSNLPLQSQFELSILDLINGSHYMSIDRTQECAFQLVKPGHSSGRKRKAQLACSGQKTKQISHKSKMKICMPIAPDGCNHPSLL